MTNTVFIISGTQGEGKTTRLKELTSILSEGGIKLAGFVAEGDWKGWERNGFTLTDIRNGENSRLCTAKYTEGWLPLGRFYFDPKVIQWGEQLLLQGIKDQTDLFVLDEMGKFELAGNVWHDAFISLIRRKKTILVTVRTTLVCQFVEQFNLDKFQIFKVGDDKQKVVSRIIETLK